MIFSPSRFISGLSTFVSHDIHRTAWKQWDRTRRYGGQEHGEAFNDDLLYAYASVGARLQCSSGRRQWWTSENPRSDIGTDDAAQRAS
jgi:hypothetical protein